MLKIDGVTDVHVSLEAALTHVDLRPGNTVTLDELRTVIRRSGFRAGDVQITAVGVVRERKDQLVIDLAPAKAELPLATGNSAALTEAREFAKAGSAVTVQVEGTIQKDVLTLQRISRVK